MVTRTRVSLILGLLLLTNSLGAQRSYDTDIVRDTFGYDEGAKREVALTDLKQGCPRRDCIPSIDAPKFVPADEADFLPDDDFVLALERNGESKAYPTRILDAHEIVNDVVGGAPLAITFCPLCGSGVAFSREIDERVVEFGVSGVLYNNDLVMYDRSTETLWEQIEGRGIVGPLTGRELEMVPVTVTRWGQWRTAHPDTLVLSPDTGTGEDYFGQDYYADYRSSERMLFPVAATDKRLHPKAVVFGVEVGDDAVAYTEKLLSDGKPFADEVGGRKLTVQLHDDGSITARDDENGEQLVAVRLFWFAWYAFHPKTELRGEGS